MGRLGDAVLTARRPPPGTDAARVSVMHDHQPDFWRNLRAELAGGRQWTDRAVVLALALDDDTAPEKRAGLVSLRLSPHTIGLVSSRLLARLSMGRKGPTVQVGASVIFAL